MTLKQLQRTFYCSIYFILFYFTCAAVLNAITAESQIPLRYPASEPARELVCDLL